jgi:hypothetical protein
MDRVVVHAEDQDTGRRISRLQTPDHFETAHSGQIQVEDDKRWTLVSKSAERLLSIGRLEDFAFRLGGDQSP